MRMGKGVKRKIISFLLVAALLLGGITVNPLIAKAGSGNISMGGVTIHYEDLTVPYDGAYHSPAITITGSSTGVTIKYSYTDENTGTSVSGTTVQPSFKTVGSHLVALAFSDTSNNNLFGSVYVNITESDGGGSGSGGGSSSTVVSTIMAEYEKALNAVSSDKTYYDIDCSSYDLEYDTSEGSDWTTIQNKINDDLYSDYALNNYEYGEFKRPDRYFVDGWQYSYNKNTEKITTITINYVTDSNISRDSNDVEEIVAKVGAAQNDILAQLTEEDLNNLTAEEWVLLIHDGMVRELDFDYLDYKNGAAGDIKLHTNWGVLSGRKGLCDGYAYIFKDFMDMLAIPCQVVYSPTLNHMWNMVKVSGSWYHVDVSWDDLVVSSHSFTSTLSNAAAQKTMYGDYNADYNDEGYVSHAYFLKTDGEMSDYGYSDWVVYYPDSGSTSSEDVNVSASTTLKRIHTKLEGQICFVHNDWYRVQSDTDKKIIKSKIDGSEETSISTPYVVRYLQTDGQYLYYTDGKNLVRTGLDGSNTQIAEAATGSSSVTEFVLKGGVLVYTIVDGTTTVTRKTQADAVSWKTPSGSQSGSDSGSGQSGTGESQNSSTDSTTGSSSSGSSTGSSSSDSAKDSTTGDESDADETVDLDVGDEISTGNVLYEVTEVEDGKEVAFTQTENNSTKVSIPGTVKYEGVTYKVTSIADDAFAKNTKLTTLKLGANITSIGDYAFEKCKNLSSITFNTKIETIGEGAFMKCTSLKKIVVPESVDSIGKNAFYGCKALKTVQFKGSTPPQFDKNCFKGINRKAQFVLPSGSKSAYKKKLTSKVGKKSTMSLK